MNENELKQCLFCGSVGPDVCEGLCPKPGCKKPGLAERIAAHQSPRTTNDVSRDTLERDRD
jgi:hypothetical protein